MQKTLGEGGMPADCAVGCCDNASVTRQAAVALALHVKKEVLHLGVGTWMAEVHT